MKKILLFILCISSLSQIFGMETKKYNNTRYKDGLTALMKAAIAGNADEAKKLIDVGVDLNIQNDDYSRTALMYAVDYSNDVITKMLIKHGADLNLKDTYGATALMMAVKNNDINMVQILIDAGAH